MSISGNAVRVSSLMQYHIEDCNRTMYLSSPSDVLELDCKGLSKITAHGQLYLTDRDGNLYEFDPKVECSLFPTPSDRTKGCWTIENDILALLVTLLVVVLFVRWLRNFLYRRNAFRKSLKVTFKEEKILISENLHSNLKLTISWKTIFSIALLSCFSRGGSHCLSPVERFHVPQQMWTFELSNEGTICKDNNLFFAASYDMKYSTLEAFRLGMVWQEVISSTHSCRFSDKTIMEEVIENKHFHLEEGKLTRQTKSCRAGPSPYILCKTGLFCTTFDWLIDTNAIVVHSIVESYIKPTITHNITDCQVSHVESKLSQHVSNQYIVETKQTETDTYLCDHQEIVNAQKSLAYLKAVKNGWDVDLSFAQCKLQDPYVGVVVCPMTREGWSIIRNHCTRLPGILNGYMVNWNKEEKEVSVKLQQNLEVHVVCSKPWLPMTSNGTCEVQHASVIESPFDRRGAQAILTLSRGDGQIQIDSTCLKLPIILDCGESSVVSIKLKDSCIFNGVAAKIQTVNSQLSSNEYISNLEGIKGETDWFRPHKWVYIGIVSALVIFVLLKR